jgi:hypothetical protein
MATIKKSLNTKINAFKGKTGTIKYWVEILQDQIEIKIYSSEVVDDQETDVVILWDIIKLEELQKKPGFAGQTWWTRISESALPLMFDEEQAIPQELHESSVIDIFGNTLISKPASFSNRGSSTVDNLYSFFVESDDTLSTCLVRLSINPDYTAGFEVVGPSSSSFLDEVVTLPDVIAPISLSSTQSTVSPDSSITITVTTEAYINEVYLEPVCGILNKTRVKITNGQGSFKILTTGLEAGDEIRVKAGHKKFTGIASYSKTVS